MALTYRRRKSRRMKRTASIPTGASPMPTRTLIQKNGRRCRNSTTTSRNMKTANQWSWWNFIWKMCEIMKTLLFGTLMGFSIFSYSQTGNMNSSPYNMDNSINNLENSPRNMRNSPFNMDNSPNNLDSKNGVYDNKGNRTGYQVKEPSGVTNYYDNRGNRTGYTPSQR